MRGAPGVAKATRTSQERLCGYRARAPLSAVSSGLTPATTSLARVSGPVLQLDEARPGRRVKRRLACLIVRMPIVLRWGIGFCCGGHH